MICYDFEYCNLRLSDFGMVLCSFDGGGGVETISNGSHITFNTTPTRAGQKHQLTSMQYDDCITSTLQVCRNMCDGGDMEIDIDTLRNLMEWLNRKTFHRFRLLNDEMRHIYFSVSFNVSRVEIGGKIVGLELELVTDSPHGYLEPTTINVKNLQANELKSIYSQSDEEGSIYPDMVITIEEDGDFEMHNDMELNRVMRIANCSQGEVITINYPLISSSLGEARETKLQNDFNWVFFRIATQFRSKLNNIHTSLPCSMTIKYTPIVKVSI